MSLEVPSKICLSLKEIDFNRLEEYRAITNLLELRLDNISLSLNEFNKLYDLFDYIILKSNDINDYNKIILDNIHKIYDKIIFDIDYKMLLNQSIRNYLIENNYKNIIISFHDISLTDIDIIILNILSNERLFNPVIYKVVIRESYISDYNNLLSNIYNSIKKQLINPSIDLICFIEGDKFTKTRYYSIELGAPYTYCTFDKSLSTGIGQPTYIEFLEHFKK